MFSDDKKYEPDGPICFYTVSKQKRPVRLSDNTRRFAWESLQGRYGDEAIEAVGENVSDGAVIMDNVPGFAEMDEYDQHDAIIDRIADFAPIRLIPEEKLCGAATLGLAITSFVPATYKGKPIIYGVNHLTVDFFTAVREGLDATEAKLDDRIACSRTDNSSERQMRFLQSMKRTLCAFRRWHARYLDATAKVGRDDLHNMLLQVPFGPARTFSEAVQSLWFCFAFTRLCGNWSGIGRIDKFLGPYLDADIAAGRITQDEAREVLAHFFIKGCEWVQSETPKGSGDAQHYQNIILGGIDEDGRDVTCALTYMILDTVEELSISDFPITVRLSGSSPEKLFLRVAEVQRHGGGTVAVYNEPLILKSLTLKGYSEREAREFANDGCWEVQIPGKTRFTYYPFDALQVLQRQTLHLDTDTPAHFDDFESLYSAYRTEICNVVEGFARGLLTAWVPGWENGATEFAPQQLCTVISLFEQGCIENACSYYEGGTPYTVISPHIGGAPDAGNSLYAIDRLVFQEKRVSFDRLMQILKDDWQGEEALRQYVLHYLPCYGNDCDDADAYTIRIVNDFAELCEPWATKYPVKFPPGISTFGRQIIWAPERLAVPFGYRHGDILSGNASPTPGTDTEGATAVIRSYCKADLCRQTTGAALDIRLFPGTVDGENGLRALEGLTRGFLRLGGYFMQLDISDAEILRLAQEHPEDYKTLSVRVSGWNARFVTLDREWQEMVIERTEYKV